MNLLLNAIMIGTNSNIENGMNQSSAKPLKQSNIPAIPRYKIPMKPSYYTERAKYWEQRDEPYLVSIYLRCSKWARKYKHHEINRLLYVADQIIQRHNKI